MKTILPLLLSAMLIAPATALLTPIVHMRPDLLMGLYILAGLGVFLSLELNRPPRTDGRKPRQLLT